MWRVFDSNVRLLLESEIAEYEEDDLDDQRCQTHDEDKCPEGGFAKLELSFQFISLDFYTLTCCLSESVLRKVACLIVLVAEKS